MTKAHEHIIPEDGEVFVTTDERIGIYRNLNKVKKSKLNTPKKI